MKRIYYINLIFILSLSLLLSACGSGGGSGGGGDTAKTISGVASKGPISGGTVTVYSLNPDGSKGNSLGSGTTKSGGAYSVDIGTYTGDVLIEVTGGTYTDEATGSTQPNPGLRAALAGVTGNVSVAVTPLTEIAVQYAETLSGTLTKANIEKANSLVSAIVGIDIINTMPGDVTSQSSSTAKEEEKTYGLMLASFSQMVTDGSAVNVSEVINNIKIDLSDDTLDATADDLVSALTNFYGNPNNKSGVDNPDKTSLDDTISTVKDTLISVLIDETSPTTPTGLSASVIGSGEIALGWTASTDNTGVAGYDIYRGTTKIVTVTSINYNDTGLTADAEYCYTVKAYDANGNVSGASNQACAKTQQKVDVSALISEAKKALENQDLKTAKVKFEAAYAGDSNNKDANIGLAMTEGLMLLEDPDVIEVIQKWDSYAPTVENLVYGLVSDTFEVYGGNNPYCGTDPGQDGYTRLSTSSTASPFTFNGSYAYYLIYTPPFSQVKIDAIGAAGYLSYPYCNDGGLSSGYYLGSIGDGFSITLGGASMEASVLVVEANSGATSVTVTTIGGATAQRALTLSKALSGESSTINVNPLSQFKSLMDKLPRNRVSLLEKLRKVVARTIPFTAPSASEMQAVIDNKILPVIDSMITRINKVEGSGYTFTITPAMTGNAEYSNTILDDGDFYAFDAALTAIKTLLNIVTAYNLDVDYDIIEADPLSTINGPSGGLTSSVDWTKFFTLKSNGATKMSVALTALQDAVANSKKSYDFIKNDDPDPYTDNGMNLGNWNQQDHIRFTKWLNFAANTLNGPADMPYDEGDDGLPFTQDDQYIKIDLSNFFTNPLNRTDLPVMTYDLPIDGNLSKSYNKPMHKALDGQIIESEIWQASDLPDWKFNGIFSDGISHADAMLYLDKTILLPQDVLWGYDWGGNLAMGGDGYIYLLKEAWNSNHEARLFKIDPSNGSLVSTYTGSITYGPNRIGWVNDRVWHNNSMWASGGYYDANTVWHNGIFTVSPGDLGSASNQIPLKNPDPYHSVNIGGIASDGTNLYVGISYYDSSQGRYRSGIVKVPSGATEIPWSPFVIETTQDTYWAWAPTSMSYGDGYLWIEGEGNYVIGIMDDVGILKVDPSTGTVIKKYADGGFWDLDMYYNGRLWMIDGNKLLSVKVP